jgi:hypothetical protein
LLQVVEPVMHGLDLPDCVLKVVVVGGASPSWQPAPETCAGSAGPR